jgi:hypothetical protein
MQLTIFNLIIRSVLILTVTIGCATQLKSQQIEELERSNLAQVKLLFENEYTKILRHEYSKSDESELNLRALTLESLQNPDQEKDKYFQNLIQQRLDKLQRIINRKKNELSIFFKKPLLSIDGVKLIRLHSTESIASVDYDHEISIADMVLYAITLATISETNAFLSRPSKQIETKLKVNNVKTNDPSLDDELKNSDFLRRYVRPMANIVGQSEEDFINNLQQFTKDEGMEGRSLYADTHKITQNFDLLFLDQIDFIIAHELGHVALGHLVKGNKRSCKASNAMEAEADLFSTYIVRPKNGIFSQQLVDKPEPKPELKSTGSPFLDGILAIGAIAHGLGERIADGIKYMSHWHLFEGQESGINIFMDKSYKVAGFADSSSCNYEPPDMRLETIRKFDLDLQQNINYE